MRTQELQNGVGVGPTAERALDPRQERFRSLYLGADSITFANCYQSAIQAGFSDQTARNLTHNKPRWYSEIIGQLQGVEPEYLVAKLTQIIDSSQETTQNKLKAIDMLMKHRGMYQAAPTNNLQMNNINIESLLGEGF